VLEGQLVEHVVKEPALEQREHDFEAVLQIIKSYLK
jgi:FrmR/RcnR family transcriptional regulator, repressor of rcnA expression